MSENDYHFVDRWRVEGDVREIADIIEDAEGLTRWWPSVYLDYTELEPGEGEHGLGKLIQLHAKGWMPYTLRINFRTVETNYPNGFTLQATGDLEGIGIWTFEQDGPFVNVTYDWRVFANKPIVRKLTFLLKPIFESNHRFSMKRGEESLKLELARRHARTPEEAAKIPPPPRPTFPHSLNFGKKRKS